MSSYLIAANSIAALFLAVIIIGLYHVSEVAVVNTRYFRYCLWVCLLGLIVESLSFVLEGKEKNAIYIGVTLFLGYALICVVSVLYAVYASQLLNEKGHEKWYRFPICIDVCCAIQFFFLVVGTLNRKLFDTSTGFVVYGPWHKYVTIMPAICFLIMIVPGIKVYKMYGASNLAVLIMLFIAPGSAIFCASLSKTEFRQGFAATALTFEVVFVMIQSKIIDEANLNARIYNELSVKDVLTGLKNRRGLENYIQTIEPDDTIGVVFCDVNSLKAVNDNEGHAAGDKRIKLVADILSNHVKEGVACRVSGDEFVCIVKNMREEAFNDKMAVLKKAFMDQDRIASMGCSFGTGDAVIKTINEAEKHMYDDKSRYYKETGKERRH